MTRRDQQCPVFGLNSKKLRLSSKCFKNIMKKKCIFNHFEYLIKLYLNRIIFISDHKSNTVKDADAHYETPTTWNERVLNTK